MPSDGTTPTDRDGAHTPRPWHRNTPPARKYPMIFAGRNTHIAGVISGALSDAEVEANCNLICAAPDLLAALRACRDAMYADIPTDGWWKELIESADRAIAKAEGRAP